MYGDTLTWGEIGMWSGDCQSNSGVRGYSNMGGWECGPGTVRVTQVYGDTLTWGDIGMWSGDCRSNSGVRGSSDMGG